MPTWRNWQTRTVQVRVPQGLRVRLPSSVPFSNGTGETLKGDDAGMAYRLCTSLPSWLEGFDPPYPLHFFMVGFPSGQRGQTVNLLARLSMVRIHLPPPSFAIKHLKRGAFFCKGGMEDRPAGAAARSDAEAKHLVRQREAVSLTRSKGNPSSTTIFTNNKHFQQGAFFIAVY